MENTTSDSSPIDPRFVFACPLCRARTAEFADYFKPFYSPGIASRVERIIKASQNIRAGKDAVREVMALPVVEFAEP